MKSYDVVIVGGGPAGLSAALILGRGRRTTLLVDGDTPRNARAEAVHNFVTRDGIPPHEFRSIARAQLVPYEVLAPIEIIARGALPTIAVPEGRHGFVLRSSASARARPPSPRFAVRASSPCSCPRSPSTRGRIARPKPTR